MRRDLSEQKFGKLTIIEIIEDYNGVDFKYKAKCDCGNETNVLGGNVTSGHTKSCGCLKNIKRPKKDLTGKIFGRLTVLSLSEISRNGHYRYSVRCECGTEKTVLGTHLISGKTKSCGCLTYRNPRHWKGSGTVSLTYFNSLKRGANGGKGRKPIPFEVTIDELAWLLDEKQKGKCALSGVEISVRQKTASVDRINSEEGYIIDNIQWLHKDINMMKRHYTVEYFTELCLKVVQNAKNITSNID